MLESSPVNPKTMSGHMSTISKFKVLLSLPSNFAMKVEALVTDHLSNFGVDGED